MAAARAGALQGALERGRPADDHGPVRLRPRAGRGLQHGPVGRLSRGALADPADAAAASRTRSCWPATGTRTGSTTSSSTAATIATEFAGTSISSGIGWDAAVREGLDANPHVKFYEGGYRGYVICDVDRDRWETTLRIVTAADASRPRRRTRWRRSTSPRARRARAGWTRARGSTGRVTGRAARRCATSRSRSATRAGALVVERPTGADGVYSLFVPPGAYTVTANGVGFEVASQPVTVTGASIAHADFALTPIMLRAASGRLLPGARAEARATDLVLENAQARARARADVRGRPADADHARQAARPRRGRPRRPARLDEPAVRVGGAAGRPGGLAGAQRAQHDGRGRLARRRARDGHGDRVGRCLGRHDLHAAGGRRLRPRRVRLHQRRDGRARRSGPATRSTTTAPASAPASPGTGRSRRPTPSRRSTRRRGAGSG